MPCCKEYIRTGGKEYNKTEEYIRTEQDIRTEGKEDIQTGGKKRKVPTSIIDGYENLDNEHEKTIEGLDNIGDSIKNAFEKPFNKMKDGINKFANDTKNAMDKIPEAAKNLLKKDPLNAMTNKLTDFANKVKTAFEVIPNKFFMFGRAFRKIFQGIRQELEGMVKGIGQGFSDIVVLLQYFGIFMETYLDCGVKYIKNFSSCIWYYIIDAILRFVYLPVTLSLWLAKSMGYDLYYIETIFWNYMWKINEYIYAYAHFNLLKWPVSVRNQCYNCKRLKVAALNREAKLVKDDFTKGIAADMQAGKDTLNDAKNDFINVFS